MDNNYYSKYCKYKKKYLRLQNGGMPHSRKIIESPNPKFSVGDIVSHEGREAKILSSKRMFKLITSCNIKEERIVSPKNALKKKSFAPIKMVYKTKDETGREYFKDCTPYGSWGTPTEAGFLTDIFISYDIKFIDNGRSLLTVHEDEIKEKKQIPHLEFKRESKDTNSIEKNVEVYINGQIALLPLYKVGIEVLMGENRIIAYKLFPQDRQVIADDNAIFISGVPSLKNYTFKVRLVTAEGKDIKYYLTRLS